MGEGSRGAVRVGASAGAGVVVRGMAEGDFVAVAGLRAELWPEGTVEEHLAELPAWAADEGTCSFVAEAGGHGAGGAAGEGGGVVGFLEGRLRSHADGCATTPVGYLEGWYVVPDRRRQGVGRALVAAFERWARDLGCRELASDTWPENAASIDAHRRLGFREVDRVVTFRKPLAAGIDVPPSARPPMDWG